MVVVVPAAAPNTAPEPPVLEGRVVSGDIVKLRLPGSGVDPDGDPVTITGIASAPTLGRVVSFGANSLAFQAYPRGVGSEEFTYTVVDTRGAEAVGVIRVAVVPTGTPQPPVAVADQMMIEPGRTAHVDVIANDQVGSTDRIDVELVDPPAGVRLESPLGPVSIKAPATISDDILEVVYRLDNGLAESTATISLIPTEDYNNAPVVYDAFGRTTDSDEVTVDVLAGANEYSGAYDPDGARDELELTEVFADPTIASFVGSKVTIRRAPEPQVIPFSVKDADGGTAMASVYVPPTGTSRPYVRDDALIDIDSGKSVRVRLEDHIVNPSGGSLEITARNRVWASPTVALEARMDGSYAAQLSARGDYTGPGALLVEVAPPTGQDARPTILSIPVQVGTDKPELDCPDEPLPVDQNGAITIDVASVCNVWTLDPAAVAGLTYDASWQARATGLALGGSGTDRLEVTADGSARAGSEGVISVTAANSDPDTIRVRVVRAPPPSLLPFNLPDLRPGSSRTIDLATHFSPGVANPEPTVISVTNTGGAAVRATSSGTRVTLTAGPGVTGHAEFRVEISDVSDPDPAPERTVTSRISLDVQGLPSVPGEPVLLGNVQSRRIGLSWRPSEANGSPIDYYLVREVGSGATQKFRTNSGGFKVPENGKNYSFVVAAHNRVGLSGFSTRSGIAVAATPPGRVPSISQLSRGSNQMVIGWEPADPSGDPVKSYYVSWDGGGTVEVPGSTTSLPIPNLDNNRAYTFTIRSRNKAGLSQIKESSPFQSLGTPLAPTSVRVTDQQSSKDSTTVRVDWADTLPEGPGPTTYTVYAKRSDAAAVPVSGCVRIVAVACQHYGLAYDGSTIDYTVVAYNQPGNSSQASQAVRFEAIGKPAAWSGWSWQPTGQDNTATINYVVPDSRGAQSNVYILVDGVPRYTFNNAFGARTHQFQVDSNERSFGVSLRVCNENADRGGCTDSDGQRVQTYGPLSDGSIKTLTPIRSFDTVSWVIEGTTNGSASRLQVGFSTGGDQFFDLPGTGSFSVQTEPRKIGYDKSQTAFVAIFDEDTSGRGTGERNATTRTDALPKVEVTLENAGSCRDDVGPTPCKTNAGDPDCSWDNCGKVKYTISGFIGPFTCRWEAFGAGVAGGGAFPDNMSLQGDHTGVVTGRYAGHDPLFGAPVTIYLKCSKDHGGGQVQEDDGSVSY